MWTTKNRVRFSKKLASSHLSHICMVVKWRRVVTIGKEISARFNLSNSNNFNHLISLTSCTIDYLLMMRVTNYTYNRGLSTCLLYREISRQICYHGNHVTHNIKRGYSVPTSQCKCNKFQKTINLYCHKFS